jgi:hypothetical protein
VTGYTVHTGSNKKFTEGWDRVFSKSGGKRAAGKPAKVKNAATAKKKSRSQ